MLRLQQMHQRRRHTSASRDRQSASEQEPASTAAAAVEDRERMPASALESQAVLRRHATRGCEIPPSTKSGSRIHLPLSLSLLSQEMTTRFQDGK